MTNDVIVKGNTIFITYNGRKMVRSIWFIHYCKSFGHNCKIFFDLEKPEIAPIGIKELYEMLPKDIFQLCHLRYIVHLAIMHRAFIKKDTIHYENLKIPVSRYRIDDFVENIETYMSSGFKNYSWLYLISGRIPFLTDDQKQPPNNSSKEQDENPSKDQKK